ncbi:MAG: hypothetical protein RL286_1161 [Bacteroidota bacterium]|jgi:hypothetical protein
MQQNQHIQEIQAQAAHFVCKEVGSEILLVPLRDNVADFNQYLTLNELGSFIYKLITDGKPYEDILSEILAQYEIDDTQARQDLSAFIDQLYQYTIGHA